MNTLFNKYLEQIYENEQYSVIVTGFPSEVEAKEFVKWYNGSGEQFVIDSSSSIEEEKFLNKFNFTMNDSTYKSSVGPFIIKINNYTGAGPIGINSKYKNSCIFYGLTNEKAAMFLAKYLSKAEDIKYWFEEAGLDWSPEINKTIKKEKFSFIVEL